MQITLPWPPRVLSPNMRGHWATKARFAKRYRQECYLRAQALGARPLQEEPETLRIRIVFMPPDRRSRDLDNLLASMKHGLDGLAQALGVDDRIFRPSIDVGEIVPDGAVRIHVIPD